MMIFMIFEMIPIFSDDPEHRIPEITYEADINLSVHTDLCVGTKEWPGYPSSVVHTNVRCTKKEIRTFVHNFVRACLQADNQWSLLFSVVYTIVYNYAHRQWNQNLTDKVWRQMCDLPLKTCADSVDSHFIHYLYFYLHQRCVIAWIICVNLPNENDANVYNGPTYSIKKFNLKASKFEWLLRC